MKNLVLLFFAVSTAFQFLFVSKEKFEKKANTDSIKTVTITIVGDLMCHSPQLEYSRVTKDSFDFKPTFREIKKYLSASNITIGNLETTISGKENKYSGYPLFNSPDDYLDALKDTGFDILLTANNHSLDRGKKGILRTLEKIRENGMTSIGSFKSQNDRDSIRVIEINEIRISILAYTYGLNGNYFPGHENFLVNVIDTNLIKKDIQNARLDNADVVLVYFHFGNEYERRPNDFQKKIVNRAINYGADVIIGSHPHVIQPIEFFNSTTNRIGEGLVAFSLGNFISNQRWRYSDAGVVLNLTFTKNIADSVIKLANVNILPTWVFKGKTEMKKEFVILPADTSLIPHYSNYLTKKDKEKIIQANNDTRKTLNVIHNNSSLMPNNPD